jgi:hypothetical protein
VSPPVKPLPPKTKRIRPTYRAHTDESIQGDIRARLQAGCPFFDWLTEIRLDDIAISSEGATEFDRGVAEGMRRLARQIQEFALSDQNEGGK